MPPQQVILEPLLEEFLVLNTNVTYKCKRGFEPRGQFTAVCISDGTWFPNPTDHVCTGDCLSNLSIIMA